ncbi:hypothetical protein E3N88_37454 [Mikania micrantha]|uniref:Uncharacterized protein n=1 Tax=Mikania micrantha TaxID=192012 RepID=A0A5N6LR58_9ASTR|nr:hypothetical protein E3N88_37454 [Mikania micrantha]
MCRYEANCIKDIVGKISSTLSSQITNINEDFVGIETRVQDFKSKLEIGSGGVRMVGIWGVGGGGKTTLASVTYTEISHQFEAHCFLENIRDKSRKYGLEKLQKKLLSLVLKEKQKVEGSEIERKNKLKRRLREKRVLVVLDDVDDLEQLQALAGSHDWFGEGSRIIITTRDKHLLSRGADTIYEVRLLSNDEAMELFTKHACQKDKPIEGYEKLSRDVVSYASCLPLAIEILGSFLYDKDKDEWKSVLDKLRDIPDVKVTERLKISYDGLEHYQKELFLDIACFLRKWPLNRAMRVLNACSFHPGIGVPVLVKKSLIKVSNGIIDMHDLVEEMAHYIVRGEHPYHPEKCSRIWKERDIVEFCATGAKPLMENNHIEVLALPSYVSDTSVPHSFPRIGQGKLAKRDIFSSNFATSSLPSYVSHPYLPDAVANMNKLRWIYWEGYPSLSFPINFEPTKLGCLILIKGRQVQLWEGYKHLPNLKILDLRGSDFLKSTPDFSGLPCLERLVLDDCKSLVRIDPSIGYHIRLVYVSMHKCSRLEKFPSILRMEKLETLDLSNCFKLQDFPHIGSYMDCLENLVLSGTGIIIIPESVGKFCTNLVLFDLSICRKLKQIDGNFRHLKRLKHLHLLGCDQLEKLGSDFFDKECCLEVLSLTFKSQKSKPTPFEYIMQYFRQDVSISTKLPQLPRFLRKLDFSRCDLGDGDIPDDISGLLNLQVLYLCENIFSRLDSRLSRIPCLKLLNLSHCAKLVELPDLPSSIAILQALYCDSLQSVGDLSCYKCLWKVSLWRETNKLNGGEKLLRSMLQVNALEDRFMSVQLPLDPWEKYTLPNTRKLITLQLPHNWYNDFSGFLFCTNNNPLQSITIVIRQEMSMDSQPNHDHWEAFDKNKGSYEHSQVGYVPFSSLGRTPCWISASYTNVTFEIISDNLANPKIGLVPRRSVIGDCSECWDEGNQFGKAFTIKDDPKSSYVMIVWNHVFAAGSLSKDIIRD